MSGVRRLMDRGVKVAVSNVLMAQNARDYREVKGARRGRSARSTAWTRPSRR